jgi:hypothetical protein
MALSKITNLSITDDAVRTVGIQDDNVTLAKLGDGTQGDILYYGASGAPTRLGFGTSGDFLKTQGTGANPAWATVTDNGKVLQVLSGKRKRRKRNNTIQVGVGGVGCSFLDSPSTTSATTYKVQWALSTGSTAYQIGAWYAGSTRPLSTITVMEIGA